MMEKGDCAAICRRDAIEQDSPALNPVWVGDSKSRPETITGARILSHAH